MGFTVESQLILFLYSFIFSLIVGIEYDIFRVSRLIFHLGVWSVFIEDLIFFLLVAIEFFFFCFFSNGGEIRIYIILTCIAGFLFYYLTVGKFIYSKIKKIIMKIKNRGGRSRTDSAKNREE